MVYLKSVFKGRLNLFITLIIVTAMVSCSGSGGDDVEDFTPQTGSNTNTGTNTNSNNNDVAPAFTLKSLSGSDISLSNYANKVVVLFFFGNNCPPCKAAGPTIESELTAPFASNADYQILGLDQWDGNVNSVQAFKASTSVSFPLLLNASGVASDYKTTYDRLLVINKEGKIVFSGKKGASSDIASVNTLVKELLGN